MHDSQVKATTDFKYYPLELNPTEVYRTLKRAKLSRQTAMFTLYRGELVTFAQAIDMREGDR